MKKLYTIILLIIMCCSSMGVAQSEQSAEELARAYITARNTYDIEATKTLLTSDAKIIELGDDYSIEQIGDFLAYAKMQDMRWEVEACTTESAVESKVSCSYLLANSISDALDIEPIPGGTFEFEITDGKISNVILEVPIDFWQPNVFAMMIGFIRANHVEDFQTLLPDGFPSNISDEGLAMWRSYTDEFVETMAAAKANTTITASEQIGFDFLEARGNWDAETLFALMADDFESYDLQRASSLEDYQDAVAYYKALNWNWTAKRCDDIGKSGDVHKVMCVAELSNDLSRGLNNGSYNMGWGLEVQDDKIIGIYPEWNRTFVNNNIEPFRGYLLKNHNNDLQKIYSQSSQFLPRGEEALALLKTYVAEFLAAQ